MPNALSNRVNNDYTTKKYTDSKIVYILLICLVVFRPIDIAFPGFGFSLFDELIVVVWVVFTLKDIINGRLQKTVLPFFFMLFYILVQSYYSQYYAGAIITFVQTVIHLKFLIFFFLFYFYLRDEHFHKFVRFLIYFTSIGLFLNIVFGVHFFEFFNIEYRERFGIWRYVGFQIGPNVTAIALSTFIFYLMYFGTQKEKFFLIPTFIILLFLTGSHTGLVLMFMLLFIYILDKKYQAIYVFLGFTILPLIMTSLIFLSGLDNKLVETYERFETGNESGYARTVVLYNGLMIAVDNFPFGAGSGSYATPLSQNNEVYYDYDMDKVTVIRWFLEGENRNTGIYDTTFGIILGELGFLGSFVYILFHLMFIYSIYKKSNKKFVLTLLMWLIILFIAATKPLFIQWDFLLYITLILLIPIKNIILEVNE